MTRRTVLLVDDEAGLTAILAKRLTARGLVVKTAASGEEGLELVRRDPDIGLAVLDINMPGLDGLETLRALRDPAIHGSRATVPVIALTAYAMAGDRERFLAAGMDDYLAKPVETSALRAALGRIRRS